MDTAINIGLTVLACIISFAVGFVVGALCDWRYKA